MHIIGLVGGIASGKSAVAAELEKLGAKVLDADSAAHEVINLPDVRSELVSRWGKEILQATGEIDRRAVASRVFSPAQQARADLQFLGETLHPRIRRFFEKELEKMSRSGTLAVVIDAPLLVEAGWHDLCDSVIFVDADRAKRLERATLRNWTKNDFTQREASQLPIEEKRQHATHKVANDGTVGSLRKQILKIWESLSLSSRKSL